VLAAFTALTLIPLWENIFVYTTDVKLLELSNLNHPLLKELIGSAPGTYHHSLIVGSMCESAAEAIGANPLLAKVCAYYHDIGKSDHSQYFIENQRPGENRHDHINPGMSKTILVAHVKDGVEKAHKYKLGGPIIDVIEQHHGTTLISFFYHKAKEHEDTEMHEVTEEEYRYPGPKPQFREAALCMLADSIEAAARSLDEPTPARLQSIVHNIVQKKFLDGQLDECNLTLRDLNIIEDAFTKILLGIYHQRIDYPTGKAAAKRPATPPTTTSVS
jgi:cyclic-di-AMP phosphodiesterase PgpH